MEHVPLATRLVSICWFSSSSSSSVVRFSFVIVMSSLLLLARSFANDVTNLSRFQFKFTSFKLKYSALRALLSLSFWARVCVCVCVGHGFYFAIFLASLKFYKSWVWFNLLCFRFFSSLFSFAFCTIFCVSHLPRLRYSVCRLYFIHIE